MEPKIMAHNGILGTLQPCTISDVCRLCANLDSNMIPIYADEGIVHMLENKIKIHLPFINISKNDLLPKRVCYHCASAVLVWNELYECSSDADQRLRSMFEAANSYNLNECKVQYDDIEGIHVPVKDFIVRPIEYEEITDVNLFNKNDKSDKTLNELDKVPSTSKSECILSHEDKSSDIQEDERLNPTVKRYTVITESDATLNINATKETSLSNNYSCSFCPEFFLKIRDKVKHDRCVHGVYTNILPIKYVSDRYLDSLKDDNDRENNTDQNTSSLVGVNETKILEKKNSDLLCIVCNISFKTLFEKSEHDKILHNVELTSGKSKHVDKNYDESDFNVKTQTNPLNLKKTNNHCVESNATDKKNDTGKDSKERIEVIKNENIDSDVKSDIDKNFKCDYCHKQFTRKYIALKHIRSHILNDKKSIQKSDIYDKYKVTIDNKIYYKCDQCNYAIEGRRYKFIYHMRVHTGEKPYTCEKCSKQFRTAAFLRRHIICFHEKVRSYQCDICGRSFSEKRNVDDHRRTHTGERPFVCETCGKSFAQRSSMKIHWKQMHESIKSHKCQYCDKSFIRRCHLIAHLTHHTGVRNYVCAICGKAFLRSGTLKGHTAVHSSERPFRCTICGDTFKLKKHLKQHGKVHGNHHSFENRTNFELN